jgi:hypothetical protein
MVILAAECDGKAKCRQLGILTGAGSTMTESAKAEELPDLSERQKHGMPSNRRILQLVEEIFGHSRAAQIDGLLKVRKGEQVTPACRKAPA